jgi:hypothetical protein
MMRITAFLAAMVALTGCASVDMASRAPDRRAASFAKAADNPAERNRPATVEPAQGSDVDVIGNLYGASRPMRIYWFFGTR